VRAGTILGPANARRSLSDRLVWLGMPKRAVIVSGAVPGKPKKKCCVTRPRCKRCPLRMLTEGTLPDGYTIKKRRLVRIKGAKKRANAPAPIAAKRGKKAKGLPEAA
jgi:hypothetical protein